MKFTSSFQSHSIVGRSPHHHTDDCVMKIDKDWFVYLEEGTGMRLPCKCKTLATSIYTIYISAAHHSCIPLRPTGIESSKHHQVKGQGPRLLAIARDSEGVTDECPAIYSLTPKQTPWIHWRKVFFSIFRFFSCFTNFSFREFPPSKEIQTTKPMVTMVPSSPATQTPLGAMLRWRSWALASASSLRNTKTFKKITEVDLRTWRFEVIKLLTNISAKFLGVSLTLVPLQRPYLGCPTTASCSRRWHGWGKGRLEENHSPFRWVTQGNEFDTHRTTLWGMNIDICRHKSRQFPNCELRVTCISRKTC